MSATAAAPSPPFAQARVERARRTVAPFAALYPFEHRFHALARRPDVALHYLDEGPQGPLDGGVLSPLLCVHGNPTWSFFFRDLVLRERARRRVVAPDHVGCGLSDKPQDDEYTLARRVDDLEELVLALDLRDVTLVAHDWGGAIGFGVATRHPERFSRLVVLNTAAFRAQRIPLRIAACRVPLVGALAVRGLGAFERAATRMAVERALPALVRRGYVAPYDSPAHRVAVHAFVRDIPVRPSHRSYAELVRIERGLERLAHLPTLVVWGERDWCFTPRFRAEWERRFPRAQVLRIEDAGHWVLEDAGERALGRIERFLTENDAP